MSFVDVAVAIGGAIAEGATVAGNVGGALAASVLPEAVGGGAAGAGGIGSLLGATAEGTAGSALAGTSLAPEASSAALSNLAASQVAAPTTFSATNGVAAGAAPTTAMPTTGGAGSTTLGQLADQLGLTASGQPVAGSVPASSGVGATPSGISAPVSSVTPQAAVAGNAPASFLEQYKTPLMLAGLGLTGASLFAKPTQATPPGQVYNPFGMIKFDPRTFQAPQPTYIRTGFAGGGITSLNQTNPDPNMMNSGSDSTDFMGQGAYPMSQQKLSFYSSPTQMPTSAQQAMASYEPNTNPLTGEATNHFASGGIADLGKYSDGGRMTRGPGDGMSDDIPATIAGKQPARLADSEFVVPADVVSHLGNGSTDAGAKQLYAMMDRVRKARTGKKAQAKQINAARMMPA